MTAPGFAQRFAGAVSDDGRTIAGTFENSPDGWIWERDFDIVYTRVG